MIAIDSNVLLRYLLEDEPGQHALATRLLHGSESVLVTDTVLVETLWTLRGKRYGLDREALAATVQALFAEPMLCFEDHQAVWRALGDFRRAERVKSGGKWKQADFPDALVVNKAVTVAATTGQPLRGTYSFDVAAQQLRGVLPP